MGLTEIHFSCVMHREETHNNLQIWSWIIFVWTHKSHKYRRDLFNRAVRLQRSRSSALMESATGLQNCKTDWNNKGREQNDAEHRGCFSVGSQQLHSFRNHMRPRLLLSCVIECAGGWQRCQQPIRRDALSCTILITMNYEQDSSWWTSISLCHVAPAASHNDGSGLRWIIALLCFTISCMSATVKSDASIFSFSWVTISSRSPRWRVGRVNLGPLGDASSCSIVLLDPHTLHTLYKLHQIFCQCKL